ncbi:hypothetical protein HELRODRAFT_163306 [Helobdella robusta]|uniref:Uncharacterized protein n=1 Tax=Helobdella robusta TaxID=6412 RepID=T1ETW0_HELRO|nr:hypothetical protein HELRODRAFT_163306 [Helobdella robusta]ESN96259.1 hypothetical protein HELRODRAFT_163306 [Helobdella robusta]
MSRRTFPMAFMVFAIVYWVMYTLPFADDVKTHRTFCEARQTFASYIFAFGAKHSFLLFGKKNPQLLFVCLIFATEINLLHLFRSHVTLRKKALALRERGSRASQKRWMVLVRASGAVGNQKPCYYFQITGSTQTTRSNCLCMFPI